MIMAMRYMVQKCKKIPFKEVWGYYRISYGPPPAPGCKDWFDPDEDDN